VDIAIRSALTGHLILSTLHTNDAISSIGRLTDMGAEPFLVASVLEGLLAQRLGRRLCARCRQRTPLSDDARARLTQEELVMFRDGVWKAVGCEECRNQGYRSRIGFFELLRINPKLRAGISKGLSTGDLKGLVDSEFLTMRQDGMRKAQEGATTIDEVLRATQEVDEAI
jgi:type II secretory ATPase GspE/PulE/Tfp pilus assembly ATPase PilB-like protein